jgi:hypothetical protein
MFNRPRLGAVVAVAVMAALLTVGFVFGHSGDNHSKASAAHPSASATTAVVSHAPNAPTAHATAIATPGNHATSTTSAAAHQDPYRLGSLPKCDTAVPKVGTVTVPAALQSSNVTQPSVLVRNVVTLLRSVYTENYNDTHQCRVARVENTHLVAGNWVYSGMDLSVQVSTPADIRRINALANITGTVQTDQMSLRVVTPTDVYVYAPVQISTVQYGTSLFKTGTTWVYKGGNWLINDFSAGSDS